MLALDEKMKEIYKKAEQRWKEIEEQGYASNEEIRELTKIEAEYIIGKLHKTKKRISIEMTRTLLELLYENKVITAKQLYEYYGWNNKPLLHRLNVLWKHKLVRRVSKKYYLATPRLIKFVENRELFDEVLPLSDLY